MPNMRHLSRLWITFEGPVDRRAYVASGALLFVVKYALDLVLTYAAHGSFWPPWTYFLPVFDWRRQALGDAAAWLSPTLLAVSLPFMWIGMSMSVRRAVNAGRSPWIGLTFLIPVVHLVAIPYLALAAERHETSVAPMVRSTDSFRRRFVAACAGIGIGVAIALVMVGVCALIFESYDNSLFFLSPVFMGVSSGYWYNRVAVRPAHETVAVGALVVVVATLALLMIAAEGVFCLAMAAPIAFVLVLFGALIGRAIAGMGATPIGGTLILLLLPFLSGFEAHTKPPSTVFEVRSHVDVAAPADVVWRSVISFSDIKEPPEWFFRHGISYPIRARIEGEGVGAVRYCEFSTGPFVEPVTHWEPGKRLAFGVTSQPPPMEEWTPYRGVHPPHLDGYLESQRGEFRLVPLVGGGTRLEGSTWYVVRMSPEGYWRLWSDFFIGRIHARVLRHIKREAEAGMAG